MTQVDPRTLIPKRAFALTSLGLWAENITHAFWPLWSVLFVAIGLLMLGVQDVLPVELVWGIGVAIVMAGLWALWRGARRFKAPHQSDVLDRLDQTLVGRPIQALCDDPATDVSDPATQALWLEHQRRMGVQAAEAKAVDPDLRVSDADPFALRYVAALVIGVAVLFGSIWRMGSVTELAQQVPQDLANGPMWEGWASPPAYTGLPVLYLNDQEGDLTLPVGSKIMLRLYGKPGALTIAETISGRMGDIPAASDAVQEFDVSQSGELTIDGDGGQRWAVKAISDRPPKLRILGQPDISFDGEMSLPFRAEDDYGIVSGKAQITLDVTSVDRRHGLVSDPDPRGDTVVELPMPLSGARIKFAEDMKENFSDHPWAHLPVIIRLSVTDEADQTNYSEDLEIDLPARRFFDPVAASIIEMRRDLLWARGNAPRVAQVLRAVSHKPDGLFSRDTDYLRLRVIARRLESFIGYGLTTDHQDEIAQALWDLAVEIEDGDIDGARQRMQEAQERLSEAMRNGANEQEIERLMQELRNATQDYMRMLAQEQARDAESQDELAQNGETMQMNRDDLQQMMDRIQELMEQGRMAEAQQALEEFQRMMENMQITQGQGGAGQQAMDDLAQTLRDQQDLSDESFRDLQEEFNPQQGEQGQQQQGGDRGQEGQERQGAGEQGEQGQGQTDRGQPSGNQQQGETQQGQNGQQSGPDGQQQSGGEQDGQRGQSGSALERNLAERQGALRGELNRQRNSLPEVQGENADAAREALDRAGRAMEGAEQALRDRRLGDAIDQQADAIDALREGIQNYGEALVEAGRENQGQGQTAQTEDDSGAVDPLGRNNGGRGRLDDESNVTKDADVYRRAQELLDEIRRRSGNADRPDIELDYLKRLLERY